MLRRTVYCIVEGQTENAVLKRLLMGYLGQLGIDFHAPIVKVGSGRGGVKFLKADDLYEQIRKFLMDKRQPYVTTFFDYYGFPTGYSSGWDFVLKPKAEASFRGAPNVAAMLENELKSRALTGTELPNGSARLIPYLQLHELECLFFAEPRKMADAFGNPALASTFQAVVAECGGCEEINDSPLTAPSKRIQQAFPGYIKGRSDLAHAPRIADRLDLAMVRQKCPRFNAWVTRLESLGVQPTY